MGNLSLSQAPVFNKVIDKKDLTHVDWQTWFNEVHDSVDNNNLIANNHLVLNPDFHWSRTKGNTPTVGNGEFVEEWDVDVGGMTSTVTPTYYSSTLNNSRTGSERYVNFNVTNVTANPYEIYQEIPDKLNKFVYKTITFSSLIKNNSSMIKIKFHVGIDTDNDGIEDFITESKPIFLNVNSSKAELISATFDCPEVSADNQNNTVYIKMIIFDVSNNFDFDLYFIKPEFSKFLTPLYVDQTLEKLKIDNA